jgi:hypothetical protein
MAITVSSVKNKNQLVKHISTQSDFDVVGVIYGTKAEVAQFIASQTQQQNRTFGVALMCLKGTPNITS